MTTRDGITKASHVTSSLSLALGDLDSQGESYAKCPVSFQEMLTLKCCTGGPETAWRNGHISSIEGKHRKICNRDVGHDSVRIIIALQQWFSTFLIAATL